MTSVHFKAFLVNIISYVVVQVQAKMFTLSRERHVNLDYCCGFVFVPCRNIQNPLKQAYVSCNVTCLQYYLKSRISALTYIMSSPLPLTQKAWYIVRQGSPERALVLKKDLPVPRVIPKGEILIKIQAAALNPGYLHSHH